MFGLALADIHGMDLDKDQSHALIYGLTNERVAQQQIATMASDVAQVTSDGVVATGQKIAAGRSDWSHWASTLSDALPGSAAQSLLRTIQTGELDPVREGLTGKQRASIEYGVGAVTGGVARFTFGRDVVSSSRTAFPAHRSTSPSTSTCCRGRELRRGQRQHGSRRAAGRRPVNQHVGQRCSRRGRRGRRLSRRERHASIPECRPRRGRHPGRVEGDDLGEGHRWSVAGAADAVGGRVAGLFGSRKRKE